MPKPENVIENGFRKHPENINKKGRPLKLPELEILVANVLGKVKKGRTEAENILIAVMKKALKGDVRAAELLLEKAYGKSVEKFEHRVFNGVEIIFTDDDINE